MRLGEIIERWLGTLEVVIAGADDALRQGELHLAAGNPMAARVEAKNVLARVPGSPLGLALLADACEAASLRAELALTLEELALRIGSQAEIWVRLARARQLTDSPVDEVRDAYIRAIGVAESGSEARRAALLALADIDLGEGDGARAELWLDRVARDAEHDVMVRRAEARLALGDARGALEWVARLGEAAPTDGRDARVRGWAWALGGEPRAFPALLRALVLDEPGASELLSSCLAHVPSDEGIRTRIRSVIEAKGEDGTARWNAAFARAEGRREEARRALSLAVRSGETTAARSLLDAAIDDQDEGALSLALGSLSEVDKKSPVARAAARLPQSSYLDDPALASAHFDALAQVTHERVVPWANELRRVVARALVPPSGQAAWSSLLSRLEQHARELHDLDMTAAIARLAEERGMPVRLAIVGEFNAGKSTFINALMGQDVAPTGVLPTTATLHHLRYAPDPIARISLRRPASDTAAPAERIVPVSDLKTTLQSMAPGEVRRVEILLPIVSLTRVEVIDTPGFNAPDQSHAEAARAAFDEADAVVWLLDAGQAMKQTERTVLEQVKAARLPIQVLVNKADRLKDDELDQVMASVDSSLREVGVASWSPPLAFSAKLALRGRLGDEGARAASRWATIDAMLDAEFVGKADLLKERALRRRVSRVVAKLGAAAAGVATREADETAVRAARLQGVSRAAARLDADRDDATKALEPTLTLAGGAFQHEIDMVVTGRDARATAADPLLVRYRAERALALVAPRLAEAMAELAGAVDVTSEALLPAARALVRAFVARPGPTSFADLAPAAVGALIDHLSVLSSPLPSPSAWDGKVRELMAVAEALQGA